MSWGICEGRMLGVGECMVCSRASIYIIRVVVVVDSVVPTGHEHCVLLLGGVVAASGRNRSCLHHRMGFELDVASMCAVIGGLHEFGRRKRRPSCACQSQCR